MSKPFHAPPVHRRHLGYSLALPWVIAGITRFHRMEGVEGLEHVPKPGVPLILVVNHQNGLMDPLVLCTLLSRHHIHWLTRADIFVKPIVRALLFSFNMMPIYRRRDRLADISERNERIFEVCVERLNIGATIGLFPEGNHHGERGLRPLKRGVIDMLNLAQRMYPDLAEKAVLLPIGLDYEDYGSLRRRLRYRIGAPIDWKSMRDPETGEFPAKEGSRAISAALEELMVNVQPDKHYTALNPYVQAMRSTETDAREWPAFLHKVARLKELTEDQLDRAETAWKAASAAGVGKEFRAEDLGHKPADARKGKWWTWVLAPFILTANALNIPVSLFMQSHAKKRVKDVCFVSTFKTAGGMALFPLVWAFVGAVIAILGPFPELGGGWTFVAFIASQTLASRVGVWWYGHFQDEWGHRTARKFWGDESKAKTWTEYIRIIEE